MTHPHILIIEDEQIVALDLAQMLHEFGYESPAIAASSEEAIAHAEARAPDLLLTDVRIKGTRDGIDTAQLLRGQHATALVFLTAHADEQTIARAKELNPEGYLVKPVRALELRTTIEVALFKFQADRRLRGRERWFATTLLSIDDAVVAINLGGRLSFLNPVAEALLGCSDADLGRPIAEVLSLSDGAREVESPVLVALREGKPVERREGTVRNLQTGESRLVSYSAAPVIDDTAALGAVMVFRDITHERAVRQRLEVSDRLASLGTMAAGLAHEINNPLAVLKSNADLVHEQLRGWRSAGLLPASECAPVLEMASDLRDAARRVERIVGDLRVFSRPGSAVPASANVQQTIEWALRIAERELRDRARIVTEQSGSLHVCGDNARLGQVLVHLLKNASEAIEPGAPDSHQITIRARAEADTVVIEVEDTGRGIPAEHLDKIFEPFFTTKSVGAGTGLGLSVCHGIITSLNGSIEVASEVSRGTLFRLRVPSATAAENGHAPATQTEAPTLRILVVDDDPIVLRVLARALKRHRVVACASGGEALSAVDQADGFDVILSDLTMPVMNGVELYEALRARHPQLAQRVVFVSGGAISPQVAQFVRESAVPLLHKPFEPIALERLVQEVAARSA